MEQLIASLLAQRQGQQQQPQQPQQPSQRQLVPQLQQLPGQLRDLQGLTSSEQQLFLPLLHQTLSGLPQNQTQNQNQQGQPQQRPTKPSAGKAETSQADALQPQLLGPQQGISTTNGPGIFGPAISAASTSQSRPSAPQASPGAKQLEELWLSFVGNSATSASSAAAAAPHSTSVSNVSPLLLQLVDHTTRTNPCPLPALTAAKASASVIGGGPPKDIKDAILELLVKIISIEDPQQTKDVGELLIRLGTLLQQGSLSRSPPKSQGTQVSSLLASLLGPSSGLPNHQTPQSTFNSSQTSSQLTINADPLQKQLHSLLQQLSSQQELASRQRFSSQQQQQQQHGQRSHNAGLVASSVSSTNLSSFASSSTAASNLPMDEITNPGPHDILFGRGSGASNHPGNIRYRTLIEQYKPRYTAASRVDKPKLADEIVLIWRNLIPPGRFLARADDKELGDDDDYTTGRWRDVGDTRAKTKTCQCLREKERPPRPSRKRAAAAVAAAAAAAAVATPAAAPVAADKDTANAKT